MFFSFIRMGTFELYHLLHFVIFQQQKNCLNHFRSDQWLVESTSDQPADKRRAEWYKRGHKSDTLLTSWPPTSSTITSSEKRVIQESYRSAVKRDTKEGTRVKHCIVDYRSWPQSTQHQPHFCIDMSDISSDVVFPQSQEIRCHIGWGRLVAGGPGQWAVQDNTRGGIIIYIINNIDIVNIINSILIININNLGGGGNKKPSYS